MYKRFFRSLSLNWHLWKHRQMMRGGSEIIQFFLPVYACEAHTLMIMIVKHVVCRYRIDFSSQFHQWTRMAVTCIFPLVLAISVWQNGPDPSVKIMSPNSWLFFCLPKYWQSKRTGGNWARRRRNGRQGNMRFIPHFFFFGYFFLSLSLCSYSAHFVNFWLK